MITNPIWLISNEDKIGVQKLKRLPIPLEKQLAKICISLGMDEIELKHVTVEVYGEILFGTMALCDGFDIVPFVGGMEISENLLDRKFSLTPPKYWLNKKSSQEYDEN